MHMSQQLFEEIKEIEAQAEQVLSESERKSAEILKKANEDALRISAEKEAELKGVREKKLKEVLEKAEQSKINEFSRNKKSLSRTRSLADKRKERAVKLVMEELSKFVGE